MLRRTTLVVLAFVVTAACSSGDGAVPNELTPDRTRLEWTGDYLASEESLYDAPMNELRAAGQVFKFKSSLGDAFWDRNPGSIHVGIRWNDPKDLPQRWTAHLLSLYVLDGSGKVVASEVGTRQDNSTAMSVEVESARAGEYEVLVVPNDSDGTTYEGVVLVKRASEDRQLPDLVPHQPTNFLFRLREDEPASCYPMEVTEAPGLERCLRFDAVIENDGAGPFITESDISGAIENKAETLRDGTEPEGESAQVILGPDGDEQRVPTGRWVIDKEHQHTHLVDLASFELYPVVDGERGERIVSDVKIGFCPWDLVDERYGEPSSAARRFPAQACAVPPEREGTDPIIRTIGISAGWSDVYPARRPVQYLDATDLQDGTYDVVLTIDPNGWYREADESNNVAATRIDVDGEEITCVAEPYGCPDHFTPES